MKLKQIGGLITLGIITTSVAYACFTSGTATCNASNEDLGPACGQEVIASPNPGASGTKPYANANQPNGAGGTQPDSYCTWSCSYVNPCTGLTVSTTCGNTNDGGTAPNNDQCG